MREKNLFNISFFDFCCNIYVWGFRFFNENFKYYEKKNFYFIFFISYVDGGKD